MSPRRSGRLASQPHGSTGRRVIPVVEAANLGDPAPAHGQDLPPIRFGVDVPLPRSTAYFQSHQNPVAIDRGLGDMSTDPSLSSPPIPGEHLPAVLTALIGIVRGTPADVGFEKVANGLQVCLVQSRLDTTDDSSCRPMLICHR